MKTNIFLSYLTHFFLEWKKFRKKLQRNSKQTFYVQWLVFRKSYHLWECGKILYSEACHRWQYGACAWRAGYLKLQIRSLCYTYSFSTATMVARTRLSVTLYVLCVSCFLLSALYISVVFDKYTQSYRWTCAYICTIFILSIEFHVANMLTKFCWCFPHHVRGLLGLLRTWRVQRSVCSRWDGKLPYDTNLHSLMSTEKCLVYVSDKT